MTISNVIARAREKVDISATEAKKLRKFFRNDEFDDFIITSRKKIVEAAKNNHRCYIFQNGELSKEVNGRSKIYGVFHGLGERKILVFAKKSS